MKVTKWGQSQPLAEGPCGTCGQSVLYNLRVGYVGHAEGVVDGCEEPWPYEPRPEFVKAMFAHAEQSAADVKRAIAALDSLSIFPLPANLPSGGYLTEEACVPQALSGHDRRAAFDVAGRIARAGATP